MTPPDGDQRRILPGTGRRAGEAGGGGEPRTGREPLAAPPPRVGEDPVRPARRRLLPRTIRGLTITFATASAAITSLLGLATYAIVHEEIERQIDHRIEVETHTLLDIHREAGFEALATVIRARAHLGTAGTTGYLAGTDEESREMAYVLVDPSGRRRAGSVDAAMPPPGWSEFVPFRRRDGTAAIAQAMNSALPGGGRLLVAADRAIVDQMDVKILNLFIAGFGLLLVTGTVAAVAFGRILQRRMAAIERSAEAIMRGNMDQRMPLDGSGGEFDRLSRILNRMLDRIGALVDNLRQVSGDIAHDLRTPLMRLRQGLERAEQTGEGAARARLITAALDEADDLLGLFASLLALSEIEGQQIRARFTPVALDAVVAEAVEAYRPAMEQAGKAITARLSPVIVRGDRQLLLRCVANLLDNVLVHAESATGVAISLGGGAERIALTVSDDGPGIPAEDRDRAFHRLVRLDPSRSGPGHGLGLSVVAAIAAAHDGKAVIVPEKDGFTILVFLPPMRPEK